MKKPIHLVFVETETDRIARRQRWLHRAQLAAVLLAVVLAVALVGASWVFFALVRHA